MLADHTAVATVAVKDLDAAKRFYEQTLGLLVVVVVPDEAVAGAGCSMMTGG